MSYYHRKMTEDRVAKPVNKTPKPVTADTASCSPDISPANSLQRGTTNPHSLSHADNFQLQRTIGNRALGALLGGSSAQRPVIQAKLVVNAPGDRYEQEADRVAEQVMRMPAAQDVAMEKKTKTSIMTKPLSPVTSKGGLEVSVGFEQQLNASRGRGERLPEQLQQEFEGKFGADFSGVRIHKDAQADQFNQSIQAKAFTSGKDVFFRQGTYKPDSPEGKSLVAHELTHVIQQQNSTGSLQPLRHIQRFYLEDENEPKGYRWVDNKYWDNNLYEISDNPISKNWSLYKLYREKSDRKKQEKAVSLNDKEIIATPSPVISSEENKNLELPTTPPEVISEAPTKLNKVNLNKGSIKRNKKKDKSPSTTEKSNDQPTKQTNAKSTDSDITKVSSKKSEVEAEKLKTTLPTSQEANLEKVTTSQEEPESQKSKIESTKPQSSPIFNILIHSETTTVDEIVKKQLSGSYQGGEWKFRIFNDNTNDFNKINRDDQIGWGDTKLIAKYIVNGDESKNSGLLKFSVRKIPKSKDIFKKLDCEGGQTSESRIFRYYPQNDPIKVSEVDYAYHISIPKKDIPLTQNYSNTKEYWENLFFQYPKKGKYEGVHISLEIKEGDNFHVWVDEQGQKVGDSRNQKGAKNFLNLRENDLNYIVGQLRPKLVPMITNLKAKLETVMDEYKLISK
jgi:hypothetical protein